MMKNSKLQTSRKKKPTPFKAQIREAVSSDARDIAALSSQLGYPTTALEIQARLENLERREDGRVFVAQLDNGAIVGWVHVGVVEYLMEPASAEVKGLVVDEAVRNRRIGAQLLAQAEVWMQEQGVSKMRIRSNVIREDAHRFYLQHGYSRQKSQYVFIKEFTHA